MGSICIKNMSWESWIWDQYPSKILKWKYWYFQLKGLKHLNCVFIFHWRNLNIWVLFYFLSREAPPPIPSRFPPLHQPTPWGTIPIPTPLRTRSVEICKDARRNLTEFCLVETVPDSMMGQSVADRSSDSDPEELIVWIHFPIRWSEVVVWVIGHRFVSYVRACMRARGLVDRWNSIPKEVTTFSRLPFRAFSVPFAPGPPRKKPPIQL